MPFLNPKLLNALFQQCTGFDAVFPLVNGRRQSLHAVYGTSRREDAMRAHLERGQYRITALYPQLNVRASWMRRSTAASILNWPLHQPEYAG
jgi:molybdopterin-guanine dinucleotide biosynthesis protein A